MNKVIAFLMVFAAGAAMSAPTVSNVSMTRNADTHLVTVTYTLSEAAIVTAIFEADGTELGPETCGEYGGEISRELAAGNHVFYLRPTLAEGNVYFDAKNLTVKLQAWALDCPPPYMEVNLLARDTRRFYPSADWVPGGVTNRRYKLDVILMRKIIATGIKWPMGMSDDGADSDYNINHKTRYVNFTNDYYIGVYETTQRQYRDLLPGREFETVRPKESLRRITTPPIAAVTPLSDVLPMDGVSWSLLRSGTNVTTDAAYYWPERGHQVSDKSWIGRARALTGIDFDLPTEAQWEYAARAGSSDACYDTIDDIAWHTGNWSNDPAAVTYGNSNQVHEVGLLKPNRWGLYDMLGNVTESCLDYMPNDSASLDPNLKEVRLTYHLFTGEVTDPVGPGAGELGDMIVTPGGGSNRPKRGGGFSQATVKYHNAYMRTRHNATGAYAFSGFRLVCPANFAQ